MKPAVVSLIAVVLLVGAGLGGYALGQSIAPDGGDAEDEKQSARERASEASASTSRSSGLGRGSRAGRAAGRRSGRLQGRRRGSLAGANEVEEQQAAIAQAEELERQRAVEAEQAERAENCGAPLFVDGYCPTDEEIEREGNAERLCGGPETPEAEEEAARLGIQC